MRKGSTASLAFLLVKILFGYRSLDTKIKSAP